MKHNSNEGFIGLLLLMIGLVLIVTFIVRTDLFTGGDKNILEKGQDAINSAKEVKNKLENNYKFDPEAQEKSVDSLN